MANGKNSINQRPDIKALNVAIGERLRNRRQLAGLSQETVGERIGVTFQQIQKYEKGVNRIAVSTAIRLAEALNCPVAALIPVDIGSTKDDVATLRQSLAVGAALIGPVIDQLVTLQADLALSQKFAASIA